ncbi:16589_t:CDS:2, partial [Racocetra persica]
NTTDTKFPQNAPEVVKIRTYDDGTTLVHLIRDGIQQANCSGHSLEPILRIRVIQLNGSVIEINANLDMDSLNYCLFENIYGVLVNPIVIYPLQQPFILMNYYKAKNSSDPKTYEEWGQVIDWSGKNLSNIRYGPSYINPQGVWTPYSKIVLNINQRLGFLRYAAVGNGTSQWIEFQQYSVFTSIQIAAISTVNSGYGIFYAICSDKENELLAIKCTLNAKFVSYNQTSNGRVAILYELSQKVNITGLYCDLVSVGLGHACTMVIDSSSTTNTSSITNTPVNFLSSGLVLSSNVITDILPFFANTTVPAIGWRMKAMPFGGYILDNNAYNNSNISYHYIFAYDENNILADLVQPGPFITNIY